MPKESGRTPSTPPPKTVGERLNRLFDVQRPKGSPDRVFTNREVVVACKDAGRDLSESHLSELRRGVKTNPTLRTLEAIAWFFDVRTGYFTDPAVAAEVEAELADREQELHAKLDAERAAQQELRTASEELQRAMRESGVAKVGHRGATNVTAARERARMMRALAEALLSDDESEETDD